MALEIERNLLVVNDGCMNSVARQVRIRDWLIVNDKGHNARVRIAEYAILYFDAQEILRIMCDADVLDKRDNS
jgi:CYTH domain-containing protein